MNFIKKIEVTENTENLRVINYLLEKIGNSEELPVSRNYLKKLIKLKCLLIDGKPANTADFVTAGQILEIYQPAETPAKVFKLKLPVVFEDAHLAVINKPAGIPVSGNLYKTVENALLYNLKESPQPDKLVMPQPVHRLDSLTSGLLIIAKTRSCRQILGKMLEEHKINKIYTAIALGKTPESGIIDLPIDNKKAVTHYQAVKQIQSQNYGWVSLLRLKLETGRTHQLRIHLAQEGFPILGDKLYNQTGNTYKGKGLFLAATGLKFAHPLTNESIEIKLSPPNKFRLYLNRLARESDQSHA